MIFPLWWKGKDWILQTFWGVKAVYQSTKSSFFFFPFHFCSPKALGGLGGARLSATAVCFVHVCARATEAEIKHGRECSKVVQQEEERCWRACAVR